MADILVYEPGQKAIIAWDGSVELLILSTDVRAESETTVLRIVPLPSQPESIEKGDFQSFERLAGLLQKRFPPVDSWLSCTATDRGAKGGVDIVFHEEIGAHDIWVAKATDSTEFIIWAEDFLARNQIQHQISSPRLESLVAAYIQEGIEFFVFDLIELSPDQESVEPIAYKFPSDSLYFPLKISSIIPGDSWISLFLFTPDRLDLSRATEAQLGGVQFAEAKASALQCKVDEAELDSIDHALLEMFVGPAWLTAIQTEVPLELLDRDMAITSAYLEPPASAKPIWGWVLVGIFGAVLAFVVGKLIYVNTGSRRAV